MDRVTHQSPRPRGYGSTSSLRNDSLKHTRKHERRRGEIEPRGKAHKLWRTVRPGGADRPHWPRGPSGLKPRTVRANPADCSALRRGPSVKAHITNRSDPRKTDRPPRPGGPSALVADRPRWSRTVRYSSSDRPQTGCNKSQKPNRIESKDAQEHDEHATNPSRADRPPAPRGLSARCGQNRKCSTPKVNSPKSSSDFPNC
jgi:hypothetical protein